MKAAILISIIALAAGCGGSTGSGSGGAGGTGGATGGTSGTGASGGSGGSGGFSQCFDANGTFIASDAKTCTGASTCAVVVHQTDCCGSTLLIGVEQSHLAEIQACEDAWSATLPACGCPAGLPQVEQPAGTTVSDPSAAQAVCGDFTQTSGICFSEPK